MNLPLEPFAVPVIVIGVLLVADLLLKALLRRTAVPSVVVHIGLGFATCLTAPIATRALLRRPNG